MDFLKANKHAVVDFAERVSATFIQAFLAVALVSGVSDLEAAKVAGAAGALAVGKFVYAKVNKYLAEDAESV